MPINPKHDRQRFIRYFNDNTIYYDTLNDSFRFQNDYTLKYEFALLYTYKSIGIIEMGDLLQIFSHLSCQNGKTECKNKYKTITLNKHNKIIAT
jgi:hypothetical protein